MSRLVVFTLPVVLLIDAITSNKVGSDCGTLIHPSNAVEVSEITFFLTLMVGKNVIFFEVKSDWDEVCKDTPLTVYFVSPLLGSLM